jgi:peptidoglycan/LPS O-acetylase OafA/YrhL
VATHLRIDELLFGVVLCYLWRFDGERLRNIVGRHNRVIAICVAMVLPLFFLSLNKFLISTVGLVLLEITFGALLLLVLLRPIQLSFSTSVLRRVGIASYSIYLWHLAWRDAIPHFASRLDVPASAWYVPLLLYFVGCVAVGIGAAALIEIPILRIRDRLLPSRSSASVVESDPSGAGDATTENEPVTGLPEIVATIA